MTVVPTGPNLAADGLPLQFTMKPRPDHVKSTLPGNSSARRHARKVIALVAGA